MYEKTIAGEHRLYDIVVTSSPTLIYDLLSVPDRAEYESILRTGVQIQPLDFASINDSRQVARTPIDGYILSESNVLKIQTSPAGAVEKVPVMERYTFPVYFWPHKSFVSIDSGSAVCKVRILFS